MTLASVAAAVSKSAPSSLRLYALVDKATPAAYRVEIGTEPAKMIHGAVRKATEKFADQTALQYGPVVLCPAGHVLTLATTDSSRLDLVQNAVAAHPTAKFDPAASYASGLFLLAAEIDLGAAGTVVAFREMRQFLKFGQSKQVALFYRDGRYDRLDPLSLLVIDLSFDVLAAEGTAYFDKKRTFERLFDHLGPLQKAAKATFKSVTTGLRIDGLAEMELACTTDVNLMAKMASIARSMSEDASYAKALTMPKLLSFIDANKQYGVKTTGAGSHRKLVFANTVQERYKIMHLLDDDYLRSQLTQRSYESGSKVVSP